MTTDDDYTLTTAVTRHNYLPLIAAIERQAEEPSVPVPDCTLDEVRVAAIAAGDENEFAEAEILAPAFNETQRCLTDAAERSGLTLDFGWDGTIAVVRSKGRGTKFSVQVASPLLLMGVGYNQNHEDPRLSLKLQTDTKVWKDLWIARSELVNGGTLQAKLKKAGIRTSDITVLINLLSVAEPRNHILLMSQAGWNGDTFVLANGEIVSPPGSTPVSATLDIARSESGDYGVGGSKDGANELMLMVEQEAQVVTAIGIMLLSPLLRDVGLAEPGVYHFFGASSEGKTTTALIAASVSGKGAELKNGGTVRSFSSTAYAVEQFAYKFKDHTIIYDEAQLISSASDFQRISYSLANGSTKAAGNGYDGTLRPTQTFRSAVISTGEASAKAIIEADSKLKHTAGSELRVLDLHFEGLKIDVGKARELASTHYGWVLRDFIALLVADHEAATTAIRTLSATMLPLEALNQFDRVRRRFSVIAAVLEYAIANNILPWRPGTGKAAITRVYESWKTDRGGASALPYELRTALEHFAQTLFSEQHRVHYLNLAGTTPQRRLCAAKSGRLYFDDKGIAEAFGTKNIRSVLDYLKSEECEDWGLECESGRLKAKLPEVLKTRLGHTRMYCVIDKNEERARHLEEEAAKRAFAEQQATEAAE